MPARGAVWLLQCTLSPAQVLNCSKSGTHHGAPCPDCAQKLHDDRCVVPFQVGKAWLLLSRAYQAEAADGAPEHANSAHQALIRSLHLSVL